MAKPKKVILKDGTTKWRIVTDAGRDPVTGKRKQLTQTFGRKKDADAEIARIQHQSNEGTYVAPSKLTLNQVLDGFLTSAGFEKEEGTRSNYGHALKPARERLGDRPVQSITREDIEALRDWMLSSGRKRGGTPGTGLGARAVRLTLSRLSAAFEQAVDDGKVTRNPCRRVRLPQWKTGEKVRWSEDEARQFLACARDDRLFAAWLLAMCGLRREEVCGLRWRPGIDMDAETLTINCAVVVVDGRVVVKDRPKTEAGGRTLPFLPGVKAALVALRKRQAAEKLAAGSAYRDSGFVVVDELGEQVNPEWFSDEFERVAARAGVRRSTPRAAQYTALTLLEQAGIPDSVLSAWAGHTTVTTTKRHYVIASAADLAVARDSLAAVYGLAEG